MKNTEELENPKCRSEVREGEDLQQQIYCGGAPPFSRLIQVDAAAKVDGDEVSCGGCGARAAVGVREEEYGERGGGEKRTSRAYL